MPNANQIYISVFEMVVYRFSGQPEDVGVGGVGASQGIYINYGGAGSTVLDDTDDFAPTGYFCQCCMILNFNAK